ncbi:hypothetical protein KKG41_05480 [Patescibacteria group bacterium]|nr:hypothetical protein [Patescibacteria group bacterium]MBU1890314.1 hypothetical protein [Patescibacteria group bacterium]
MRHKKNQKGITILETIIAIFVIMVGITSAVVLIIASTSAARKTKNELIASNLARETIEVIRNKRDSNWLKIESGELASSMWDDGLGDYINNYYDGIYHFDDEGIGPDDPAFGWTFFYEDDYDIDDLNDLRPQIYYHDDSGAKLYNQYDGAIFLPPAGQNTIFRRVFETNPICYDETVVPQEMIATTESGDDCDSLPDNRKKIGIQVVVHVHWRDVGNNKTFELIQEDRLYNWK